MRIYTYTNTYIKSCSTAHKHTHTRQTDRQTDKQSKPVETETANEKKYRQQL